jgi:uncharacterized protein (TIGR00369 family)
MKDLLEWGKQILADQPFSVLVGTELSVFSEGHAELRLPIRQELLQQHGFVHGGVLAYLADNALTYAGGSVLMPVITSEFKINYVRPARGELLVARANVIAAGRTQAVCRCDIFVIKDGQETLCATAQGTIVKFNQEGRT